MDKVNLHHRGFEMHLRQKIVDSPMLLDLIIRFPFSDHLPQIAWSADLERDEVMPRFDQRFPDLGLWRKDGTYQCEYIRSRGDISIFSRHTK